MSVSGCHGHTNEPPRFSYDVAVSDNITIKVIVEYFVSSPANGGATKAPSARPIQLNLSWTHSKASLRDNNKYTMAGSHGLHQLSVSFGCWDKDGFPGSNNKGGAAATHTGKAQKCKWQTSGRKNGAGRTLYVNPGFPGQLRVRRMRLGKDGKRTAYYVR